MKYDYRCRNCKKRFEVDVVGITRTEKRRVVNPSCPRCKSKDVKRLYTAHPVHFRGTGWGKDDI